MTDKRANVPGPDHPITIERNPARVVVGVSPSIRNASMPSRSGWSLEWEALHESEHRNTEQGDRS